MYANRAIFSECANSFRTLSCIPPAAKSDDTIVPLEVCSKMKIWRKCVIRRQHPPATKNIPEFQSTETFSSSDHVRSYLGNVLEQKRALINAKNMWNWVWSPWWVLDRAWRQNVILLRFGTHENLVRWRQLTFRKARMMSNLWRCKEVWRRMYINVKSHMKKREW